MRNCGGKGTKGLRDWELWLTDVGCGVVGIFDSFAHYSFVGRVAMKLLGFKNAECRRRKR